MDLRRAEVQLLDLIGGIDRQNITCPLAYLAKGMKIPGKYSARDAKIQPQISHYADIGDLPSKCLLQVKV